jgi:hypothetical protein
MGATVHKPDIFVQLDFMANATHSHALTAAAIKSVVDAFANSSFKSRTGSVGINLHVDAGPNSIMNFATGQTWGSLSRARQLTEVTNLGTATIDTYDWTAFDDIKNAAGGFTSTGRSSIFRYGICAHHLSNLGNSGIARGIPGSDFITSLGAFGRTTDAQQAGTFMHELGHGLGLQHGGADEVNNKPNYLSVMNYLFQLAGFVRGGVSGVMDYSSATLPDLNETDLNESTGLGLLANGVGTGHWCPPMNSFIRVVDGSQAIDWNCNGVTTDSCISFDVNGDGSTTTLKGANDWAILCLKGGSIGAGGDFVHLVQTLPTI